MAELVQKKKIMSLSEIDKTIKKLIESAVKSLTQMTEGNATPGCFCRKVIQLIPAQITSFSYDGIMNIVRMQMPITQNCMVKLCDAFITTYPDDVFMKFMAFAEVCHTAYIAEQFDCDDFSVIFCAHSRKWHARIRAQLEDVANVKRMLPEAIKTQPGMCVIPHSPRGDPTIPGAPYDPNDGRYIGGSPIGICHGRLSASGDAHAFNFWISSKGNVVYIEPQTGEFITLGEGAEINFVYI